MEKIAAASFQDDIFSSSAQEDSSKVEGDKPRIGLYGKTDTEITGGILALLSGNRYYVEM
jgi:hypothetical protein